MSHHEPQDDKVHHHGDGHDHGHDHHHNHHEHPNCPICNFRNRGKKTLQDARGMGYSAADKLHFKGAIDVADKAVDSAAHAAKEVAMTGAEKLAKPVTSRVLNLPLLLSDCLQHSYRSAILLTLTFCIVVLIVVAAVTTFFTYREVKQTRMRFLVEPPREAYIGTPLPEFNVKLKQSTSGLGNMRIRALIFPYRPFMLKLTVPRHDNTHAVGDADRVALGKVECMDVIARALAGEIDSMTKAPLCIPSEETGSLTGALEVTNNGGADKKGIATFSNLNLKFGFGSDYVLFLRAEDASGRPLDDCQPLLHFMSMVPPLNLLAEQVSAVVHPRTVVKRGSHNVVEKRVSVKGKLRWIYAVNGSTDIVVDSASSTGHSASSNVTDVGYATGKDRGFAPFCRLVAVPWLGTAGGRSSALSPEDRITGVIRIPSSAPYAFFEVNNATSFWVASPNETTYKASVDVSQLGTDATTSSRNGGRFSVAIADFTLDESLYGWGTNPMLAIACPGVVMPLRLSYPDSNNDGGDADSNSDQQQQQQDVDGQHKAHFFYPANFSINDGEVATVDSIDVELTNSPETIAEGSPFNISINAKASSKGASNTLPANTRMSIFVFCRAVMTPRQAPIGASTTGDTADDVLADAMADSLPKELIGANFTVMLSNMDSGSNNKLQGSIVDAPSSFSVRGLGGVSYELRCYSENVRSNVIDVTVTSRIDDKKSCFTYGDNSCGGGEGEEGGEQGGEAAKRAARPLVGGGEGGAEEGSCGGGMGVMTAVLGECWSFAPRLQLMDRNNTPLVGKVVIVHSAVRLNYSAPASDGSGAVSFHCPRALQLADEPAEVKFFVDLQQIGCFKIKVINSAQEESSNSNNNDNKQEGGSSNNNNNNNDFDSDRVCLPYVLPNTQGTGVDTGIMQFTTPIIVGMPFNLQVGAKDIYGNVTPYDPDVYIWARIVSNGEGSFVTGDRTLSTRSWRQTRLLQLEENNGTASANFSVYRIGGIDETENVIIQITCHKIDSTRRDNEQHAHEEHGAEGTSLSSGEANLFPLSSVNIVVPVVSLLPRRNKNNYISIEEEEPTLGNTASATRKYRVNVSISEQRWHELQQRIDISYWIHAALHLPIFVYFMRLPHGSETVLNYLPPNTTIQPLALHKQTLPDDDVFHWVSTEISIDFQPALPGTYRFAVAFDGIQLILNASDQHRCLSHDPALALDLALHIRKQWVPSAGAANSKCTFSCGGASGLPPGVNNSAFSCYPRSKLIGSLLNATQQPRVRVTRRSDNQPVAGAIIVASLTVYGNLTSSLVQKCEPLMLDPFRRPEQLEIGVLMNTKTTDRPVSAPSDDNGVAVFSGLGISALSRSAFPQGGIVCLNYSVGQQRHINGDWVAPMTSEMQQRCFGFFDDQLATAQTECDKTSFSQQHYFTAGVISPPIVVATPGKLDTVMVVSSPDASLDMLDHWVAMRSPETARSGLAALWTDLPRRWLFFSSHGKAATHFRLRFHQSAIPGTVQLRYQLPGCAVRSSAFITQRAASIAFGGWSIPPPPPAPSIRVGNWLRVWGTALNVDGVGVPGAPLLFTLHQKNPLCVSAAGGCGSLSGETLTLTNQNGFFSVLVNIAAGEGSGYVLRIVSASSSAGIGSFAAAKQFAATSAKALTGGGAEVADDSVSDTLRHRSGDEDSKGGIQRFQNILALLHNSFGGSGGGNMNADTSSTAGGFFLISPIVDQLSENAAIALNVENPVKALTVQSPDFVEAQKAGKKDVEIEFTCNFLTKNKKGETVTEDCAIEEEETFADHAAESVSTALFESQDTGGNEAPDSGGNESSNNNKKNKKKEQHNPIKGDIIVVKTPGGVINITELVIGIRAGEGLAQPVVEALPIPGFEFVARGSVRIGKNEAREKKIEQVKNNSKSTQEELEEAEEMPEYAAEFSGMQLRMTESLAAGRYYLYFSCLGVSVPADQQLVISVLAARPASIELGEELLVRALALLGCVVPLLLANVRGTHSMFWSLVSAACIVAFITWFSVKSANVVTSFGEQTEDTESENSPPVVNNIIKYGILALLVAILVGLARVMWKSLRDALDHTAATGSLVADQFWRKPPQRKDAAGRERSSSSAPQPGSYDSADADSSGNNNSNSQGGFVGRFLRQLFMHANDGSHDRSHLVFHYTQWVWNRHRPVTPNPQVNYLEFEGGKRFGFPSLRHLDMNFKRRRRWIAVPKNAWQKFLSWLGRDQFFSEPASYYGGNNTAAEPRQPQMMKIQSRAHAVAHKNHEIHGTLLGHCHGEHPVCMEWGIETVYDVFPFSLPNHVASWLSLPWLALPDPVRALDDEEHPMQEGNDDTVPTDIDPAHVPARFWVAFGTSTTAVALAIIVTIYFQNWAQSLIAEMRIALPSPKGVLVDTGSSVLNLTITQAVSIARDADAQLLELAAEHTVLTYLSSYAAALRSFNELALVEQITTAVHAIADALDVAFALAWSASIVVFVGNMIFFGRAMRRLLKEFRLGVKWSSYRGRYALAHADEFVPAQTLVFGVTCTV